MNDELTAWNLRMRVELLQERVRDQRDRIDQLSQENKTLQNTIDCTQAAYDTVVNWNNKQANTIVELQEQIDEKDKLIKIINWFTLPEEKDKELASVYRSRDIYCEINFAQGKEINHLRDYNQELQEELKEITQRNDKLLREYNRGCPSCGYGKRDYFF